MYKDNNYEANKAQKASIVRYTALVLVIINAVLTMLGMPIVPVEYADIISSGLIVVVGLFVGFRNNYLTARGKQQAKELANKDLLNK